MKFNEDQVRNFYRFFKHKQKTEIRVFDAVKYPNGQSTFVSTEDEFADKCRFYCEEEKVSVYIGARDRKAKGDKNVVNSNFIFFEIDEHGEDKNSEKEKIIQFLKDNNIEITMQGMSGGGYHFYIMHPMQDFETEEQAMQYKEQSLGSFKKVLQSQGFDIDGAVFNLERVTRVLGTYNYKRDKISSIEFIDKTVNVENNFKSLVELLKKYESMPNTKIITPAENINDDEFIKSIKEKWVEGDRQELAMSVAGYLRKSKRLGLNSCMNIIKNICMDCNDTDINERLSAVKATYDKDEKEVKGYSGLVEKDVKFEDITLLQGQVFNSLALKDRDNATELIVEHIMKHNHIYTTKDDIKSEMWIYRDGVYVPQGRSCVKEFSRRILERAYTTQLSNAIVSKIEADTFIEHKDFFDTNYIDEVPLINGILNINTRELTEHTPDKIFFNKLPIEYNQYATCPNIIKHFESTLKDKESVSVMLELFGYLLLKEYRIEKAIMFVGHGRNGKSKTIELMKRFIGAENCSSLPLKSLNEASFSLSELFGKMANLAADLSKTDLKETGMIKSLIGRDTVQAKRKFLRDLNFVNYAKMVFAANELPRIYDTTDGFWTKWVLLEFPYKFVTQEVYDETQEDKTMLKIMDTEIMKKLTTPDELSGLLNSALDGLDRLLRKKDYSYSKSTADVKDMWIRKSDSFTAFCYDHVDESDNGKITKKDLRKMYHKYTKIHKIGGCSDKAIHITLENMYGVSEKQDTWDGRIWEGIQLKNMEKLKV